MNLKLGRYDFATYGAFTSYALCSLAIPLTIVEMGKSLNFPLDHGGMSAGGGLHLIRSFSMVAALLLCGIVAGRLGKRHTMGVAMFLMGGGMLFCACAPAYWVLFPFLLAAGLGEGLCEGIATPVAECLHKDAPERYVNIAHSFWSVGIVAGVVLSGILLSFHVSWRIVLGVCGICGLASSVLFLIRETKGKEFPEETQKTDVRKVLSDSAAIVKRPRFWVYCIGMFMGAGAEFCLTFWSAAYLRLSYNASAWVAALGTGAIAAGMFAGRLGFGYYAKKQYLHHLLLCCALGTIPLTLLLVFLKPEMFPSMNWMFAVIILILFFCGIGIAPYWPTLQVYGVDHLPGLDSTLLYIYFSAVGIPGCGFFTWFMGLLGDRFTLKQAFLMIPVSLVLFASVIFLEGWIFPLKGERISADAPRSAEDESR